MTKYSPVCQIPHTPEDNCQHIGPMPISDAGYHSTPSTLPPEGEVEAILTAGKLTRLAFLLHPPVVGAIIPSGIVGAYLLLMNGSPIYVGRSDHCVRTRLMMHPLLGYATHFAWEPCSGPSLAYFIESSWFHKLNGKEKFLNIIHPARPEGFRLSCPFCNESDKIALGKVLSNFI